MRTSKGNNNKFDNFTSRLYGAESKAGIQTDCKGADQQQIERYVQQQMYDIGYLVAWRDNKMNAVPKLEDTPNAERLEGISEQDLQRYLAYYEQVNREELLKYWLSKSPEERYNERKKNWLYHEFNVYRLYGNAHSTPDKPGCISDSCIIECRYYRATGKIIDEEIYDEFPVPELYVTATPLESLHF